jgi:hypothetical protein
MIARSRLNRPALGEAQLQDADRVIGPPPNRA